MTQPALAAKRTRRSFLDWVLGLGTASWLGSLAYPIVRYMKPLSAPGPGGPVRLEASDVARMEKDHFVIVRSGDARVIVFEAMGVVRALDARCTHEGCTVQYSPGDGQIVCACHNGRFDLDGRVLSGPPPRPLGQWGAARDEEGNVVVSPSRPA